MLSDSSDEPSAISLPQPSSSSSEPTTKNGNGEYAYVLDDELERTCFSSYPDGRPFHEQHDALCWVLTSKGKRGRKRDVEQKEGGAATATKTALFQRARVVRTEEGADDEEEDHREDDHDHDHEHDDDDDRVLVRYPMGSTYRVRRTNLLPVVARELQQPTQPTQPRRPPSTMSSRMVLVASETPDYRRAAAVHVCVGDSFLEIGCDFGPLVDRVRNVLLNKGDVLPSHRQRPRPRPQRAPATSSNDGDDVGAEKRGRAVAIGIDKSESSVAVAKKRYPNSLFSIEDALSEEGSARIRRLCRDHLKGGFPTVVAVDINGNRELPAVLECLERIMRPVDDRDDWELPRLIVVKSRSLYSLLKERRRTDDVAASQSTQ